MVKCDSEGSGFYIGEENSSKSFQGCGGVACLNKCTRNFVASTRVQHSSGKTSKTSFCRFGDILFLQSRKLVVIFCSVKRLIPKALFFFIRLS